jgi:hypothetical protein
LQNSLEEYAKEVQVGSEAFSQLRHSYLDSSASQKDFYKQQILISGTLTEYQRSMLKNAKSHEESADVLGQIANQQQATMNALNNFSNFAQTMAQTTDRKQAEGLTDQFLSKTIADMAGSLSPEQLGAVAKSSGNENFVRELLSAGGMKKDQIQKILDTVDLQSWQGMGEAKGALISKTEDQRLIGRQAFATTSYKGMGNVLFAGLQANSSNFLSNAKLREVQEGASRVGNFARLKDAYAASNFQSYELSPFADERENAQREQRRMALSGRNYAISSAAIGSFAGSIISADDQENKRAADVFSESKSNFENTFIGGLRAAMAGANKKIEEYSSSPNAYRKALINQKIDKSKMTEEEKLSAKERVSGVDWSEIGTGSIEQLRNRNEEIRAARQRAQRGILTSAFAAPFLALGGAHMLKGDPAEEERQKEIQTL